jgi:hypothetical protein
MQGKKYFYFRFTINSQNSNPPDIRVQKCERGEYTRVNMVFNISRKKKDDTLYITYYKFNRKANKTFLK